MPAVNAVREMGFSNGKFGLWGHCFGAYAASNLITHRHLAAAVSGATPPGCSATGRVGDRDSRNIGPVRREWWEPFGFHYLAQSAFFHLDKVSTLVLMLRREGS